MAWELYEVWGVDQDGYEELIDTTNSLKQARSIAYVSIELDTLQEVIIYKDIDDELVEAERIRP